MKKRILFIAALTGLLMSCSFGSNTNGSGQLVPSSASSQQSEIERIYQLYLDNGGTLTYEEWLKTIKGEPGQDGKDGTMLRHGQGAPSDSLGNDGDSYIDLETWDYYIKVAGSWIKSGNIKGAQGEQGPQGEQGSQGEQGPQGTQGEQGPQGDKGDKGDTGAQGEQGPQGEKGDTGAQGEQGPQGEKGDKGDDGVSIVSIEKTGSDGLLDTYTITYSDGHTSTFVVANGAQGDQGIQGIPGNDGHTPVITIGDNGNWFVDGVDTGIHAQGVKGEKGDDGVSIVSVTKTSESGLADIYTITYSDGRTSTFVVMNGAKGDQGIQGIPGNDGHTPVITIGDNGNWFVDGVDTGIHAQGVQGEKGDKGDKGDTGEQGPQGDKGDTGAQGEKGDDGVSIVSIEKTGSDGLVDIYTITYSDGTSSSFTVSNGQKGDKGDKGDTGAAGSDGKSAYEIYKEAHPEYEGDEQQWLDDLINGKLGNQEVFTVTFDLGYDNLFFTQQVKKGEKAIKPENPVRKYCNFVDWVDEYNDHWVFNGYSITSDITLTAVWECPYEFTVTYLNEDGSFLAEQKANLNDPLEYPLDSTPQPGNPDPHYIYTFTGWKNAPTTITEDITVIAQYSMVYVATTAYYYDYDGTTLLATVSLAENEEPHYNGEIPTRERDKTNKLQFEFAGWNKTEETHDTIIFVANYASCTDGLDIEGNTITYYHGTSENVIIPSVWNGVAIKNIGSSAFNGNTIVTGASIPEGVTSIDDSAFYGCSSLKSISIPDGMLRIGDSAFFGCSSLITIVVPDSVTSIGSNAFSGCYGLTSVTIPEGVTMIGSSAFYGCYGLTSVTIPEGVTRISYRSFSGCYGLTSVTIPASVTSIDDSAFEGWYRLTSVTIPEGVTTIGNSAFYGCYGLTSVTIPASVTSIGRGIFDGCSSLTIFCKAEYKPKDWSNNWNSSNRPVAWGYQNSGDLNGLKYAISTIDGDSVATIIGSEPNLTNVIVPSSINGVPVVSIANYAFNDRTTIKTIEIPNSIISIGVRAFAGCSSLTKITIPSSVENVGDYAFYGCTSLMILCVGVSRPSGWSMSWNPSLCPVCWTEGDSITRTNSDGKYVELTQDETGTKEITINYVDGTTYADDNTQLETVQTKMDKGNYTSWHIEVDQAIEDAEIYFEGEKGGLYSGRYFFNQNKDVNPVNPITGENYPEDTETGLPDGSNEDAWRYMVSVNGGEKLALKNPYTYEEAGVGTKPVYFTDIDLEPGDNVISLHQMNIGYRLDFSGKVHIRYKGDATITGINPFEYSFDWDSIIQDGSSALDGGKLNKNSTYTFNVNMTEAGQFAMKMTMKGSASNGSVVFGGTGQDIIVLVNGEETVFAGKGKTYAEFFGEDQSAWVVVEFALVDLKVGENIIQIKTGSGGYRVSVDKTKPITFEYVRN